MFFYKQMTKDGKSFALFIMTCIALSGWYMWYDNAQTNLIIDRVWKTKMIGDYKTCDSLKNEYRIVNAQLVSELEYCNKLLKK
jgi:hypothetical protein